MKRILAIALALVLVLGLLAGCGSSKAETPAAPATPSQPSTPSQPAATEPAKETAPADNYPEKAITFYVHTDAGSSADNIIRRLQPYVEAELGVPLAIEYKTGGGSLLGPKMVSEAKADGYTIGMAGSPNTEIGLLTMDGMFEKEDITILCRLTADASAFIVQKDAPWNTLEELVEDAKSRPGQITCSVGNTTGDNYLSVRLLEEMTGIDLNIISFGGGSPSRLALMGGHVDMTQSSLLAAASILEDSKVLAVHWATNDWPDLTGNAPTVKELYPDVIKDSLGTKNMIIAPAGLKTEYPERYEKLCTAFYNAANNPDFIASMEETEPGLWNYLNQDDATQQYLDNFGFYADYLSYFNETVEQQTLDK